MEAPFSFGVWLRQRRKALDLTQAELAHQLGCATSTLQKIELDERRPSKAMAERLATVLAVPAAECARFLQSARSAMPADQLPLPAAPGDTPTPWHPAAPPPQHLPVPLTPLIGRTAEVAEVAACLRQPEVRLLTLTGPGGVGKTRLSLQIAATLLGDFVDGVRFVTLAPLSDPALVIPAIAQGLGVRTSSGQSLEVVVQTALRGRHLLLVLDNFEQVLAAAVQVADLLHAAPALKVLATSRALLHLAGEHQFAVHPLTLPALQQVGAVAHVTQSEACALFIARAQAVQPDFVVTAANAPTVAAICTRLDGLPLAIELAAVRSKVLSPLELLQRLAQRLPLLTGGSRDLPARQQTIRATLDWSYHLLAADEQALFRQLGIFVGGCTLAAAEAVCRPGSGDAGATEPPHRSPSSLTVVDGLQVLLDHSLLQHGEREPPAGGAKPRFMMLDLVREYALEQLVVRGEVATLQRRHAEYYLVLAEAVEREREQGAVQRTWLEQLEAEQDNLRAVLQWALDQREATLGLRLGTALEMFWTDGGHLNEGRRWLEEALAAWTQDPTVDPTLWPKILRVTAGVASQQNDFGRAIAMYRESLALFQALGDTTGSNAVLEGLALALNYQGDHRGAAALAEERLALERQRANQDGIARTLVVLAWTAHVQGDFTRAFALLEESLTLKRELDDKPGVAAVLFGLGLAGYHQGDFRRATAWLEASLVLCQELGDTRGVERALAHLGSIAGYQGDVERATRLLDEALALSQKLGDIGGNAIWRRYQGKVAEGQGQWERATTLYQESLALQWERGRQRWEIAACLESLAGVADKQGRSGHAARLGGAAEVLREQIGAPFPPADRTRYEATVAHIRAVLGDEAMEAAWAEGRALTVAQAIVYALPFNESPGP